jgi:hypothetical protein
MLQSRPAEVREVRGDIASRLRVRGPEIENAIFARIRSLSEPVEGEDPTYVAGLRSAIAAALSYGLESVEKGGGSSIPLPTETSRQARRAAREGVGLDMVMRRYAAGNKVLEEFIVAEADDVPSHLLCQILGNQGPQVDRLLESVAADYAEELEQAQRSSAQRQADRVLHFLESNSLVGPSDLDYDFDGWHVGLILSNQRGMMNTRRLAERLGCRSLSVTRDDENGWLWLGARHMPDVAKLESLLRAELPPETSVAIGEPRKGPVGWRQTFREAQTALQIVFQRPQPITRCRDVILVSAVMRDSVLTVSLIETYLAPLDGRGASGEVLRKTLRAYFRADQNVAATAAALNVARHTVERRLRTVEDRLGQTIDACNAQLQVALETEELVAG